MLCFRNSTIVLCVNKPCCTRNDFLSRRANEQVQHLAICCSEVRNLGTGLGIFTKLKAIRLADVKDDLTVEDPRDTANTLVNAVDLLRNRIALKYNYLIEALRSGSLNVQVLVQSKVIVSRRHSYLVVS
jgi:hypothetical protein